MNQAIGQMLGPAVAVAIGPTAIIAVILMLLSERARINGIGFVFGWAAGLSIVGGVLLGVAGSQDMSSGSTPAHGVSVAKTVIGVLLVLLAFRQQHARPVDGREPSMPQWMATVETFGPGKAVGLGAVLAALNPKNLALIAAATGSIAQANLAAGQSIGALAIFVAVATLGVAIPVGVYFALGQRASSILEGWRDWLVEHNATVTFVLLLVIGSVILGQGISGL
jgi:hypothetical protein